jgi:type III secretory pathway component EscT
MLSQKQGPHGPCFARHSLDSVIAAEVMVMVMVPMAPDNDGRSPTPVMMVVMVMVMVLSELDVGVVCGGLAFVDHLQDGRGVWDRLQ